MKYERFEPFPSAEDGPIGNDLAKSPTHEQPKEQPQTGGPLSGLYSVHHHICGIEPGEKLSASELRARGIDIDWHVKAGRLNPMGLLENGKPNTDELMEDIQSLQAKCEQLQQRVDEQEKEIQELTLTIQEKDKNFLQRLAAESQRTEEALSDAKKSKAAALAAMAKPTQ